MAAAKTFSKENMNKVIKYLDKAEVKNHCTLEVLRSAIAESIDSYNGGVIVKFCKAMAMAKYITPDFTGFKINVVLKKQEAEKNVGDNRERPIEPNKEQGKGGVGIGGSKETKQKIGERTLKLS